MSSTICRLKVFGNEILADAFHLVRLRAVAGQDRPLGIRADDRDLRVALLEIARHAGDRPARAHARHEHLDLAPGILPDFGAGGQVVDLRIVGVGELVRAERAGNLLGEAVGHAVVAIGGVRRDVRGRHHHLGPVGPQQRPLVLAHLVGHHHDQPVALHRRRQRQPHAGVAGGGLDDRAAGLQLPGALGRLDHRQPHPVLHAAAGIQEFRLHVDRRIDARRDPVEPDQRRAADRMQDVRNLGHGAPVPGGGRAPPRRASRAGCGYFAAFCSAWSMSAWMSSTSSRPIDSRM
jgi:hypothetical protein